MRRSHRSDPAGEGGEEEGEAEAEGLGPTVGSANALALTSGTLPPKESTRLPPPAGEEGEGSGEAEEDLGDTEGDGVAAAVLTILTPPPRLLATINKSPASDA